MPPSSPSTPTLTPRSSTSTLQPAPSPLQARKTTLVHDLRDLVLHHEYLTSIKTARENYVWNLQSQLHYRGVRGFREVKWEAKEDIEAEMDSYASNIAYWVHVENVWGLAEIAKMEREVSTSLHRTQRALNKLSRTHIRLLHELDRQDYEDSVGLPRRMRKRARASDTEETGRKRRRKRFDGGAKVGEKKRRGRSECEGDECGRKGSRVCGGFGDGKGRGAKMGNGKGGGYAKMGKRGEGYAKMRKGCEGYAKMGKRGEGKGMCVVIEDIVMAEDFAKQVREEDEFDAELDEMVEVVWDETLRG